MKATTMPNLDRTLWTFETVGQAVNAALQFRMVAMVAPSGEWIVTPREHAAILCIRGYKVVQDGTRQISL